METRYISLEECIKDLREYEKTAFSGLTVIGCISRIKRIPPADVVPAPRWIPVEERMPALDTEVLVFAVGLPEFGFEGKTATAIAHRFIYRFWSGGKGYEQWSTPWEYFHKDYKITHWMPLPEPPKEVQDGN